MILTSVNVYFGIETKSNVQTIYTKVYNPLCCGVSQLGVYIGNIAFLRNVYDGIPATPIKREGGNLNFI